MKKVYTRKNALLKKVGTGFLILTALFAFDSLRAQNVLSVDFSGEGSIFGDPGASIKSLYYNSGASLDEGLLFTAENISVMTMYSNVLFVHKPLFLDDHVLFNSKLGTIGGLGILSGSNEGLRLKGAMPDNFDDPVIADLFITKDGDVGIGQNNQQPNGALHVVGLDNDGSGATLTLDDNRGQRMLLDGNEIDALNNSLNLQLNVDQNLTMVAGGGYVGIGQVEMLSEKVQIDGNLRLDNGLFLSNEAMIFRAGAGSDTSNNSILFQNNAEIEVLRINKDGNVGIGTSTPSQKLEVDGTVKATSFVSSASSFPDYVFDADYNFVSLSEMDSFIKTNKHLPNMPSEKEVVENGLDVSDVVVKSVENIENIYLHLIQLNEKLEALHKENAELKALLNK